MPVEYIDLQKKISTSTILKAKRENSDLDPTHSIKSPFNISNRETIASSQTIMDNDSRFQILQVSRCVKHEASIRLEESEC